MALSVVNKRYRAVREIGGDTVSSTFLGQDELLHRPVVIKLLRNDRAADPLSRARFSRGGQNAAVLTHPHIEDIYDVGEHDGLPYVIAEYVQGQTLHRVIQEEGPFHLDEVAALIEQVAAAVDYAHERGVVHGDLHPRNIIIDAHGVAKVVGFAVAENATASTQTASRTDVGLADGNDSNPVQWTRGDARSDIVALGTISRVMLAPRSTSTPLAPSPTKNLNARSVESPAIDRDPALSPELDDLVHVALDHALARRVRPGEHFARRLGDWRYLTRSVPQGFAVPDDRTLSVSSPAHVPPARLPLSASETRLNLSPSVTAPDVPRQHPHRALRRPRWPRALAGLFTVAVALVVGTLLVAGPLPRSLTSFVDGPRASPTTPAANPSTVGSETNDTLPSGLVVPDLTGMAIEQARQVLAERGLKLQERADTTSRGFEPGAVIEQEPPSGAIVAPGRTVFVDATRRPVATDLSGLDLAGKSAAVARARLADLGLNVREVERGSRTIPAGQVIEIPPPAAVNAGDTVTLIVSLGDRLQVPRETFGAPMESARDELHEVGFTLEAPIGVGRATIEGQFDLATLDIKPGDVVGVQNKSGTAGFGNWLERDESLTLIFYDPALDDSEG